MISVALVDQTQFLIQVLHSLISDSVELKNVVHVPLSSHFNH